MYTSTKFFALAGGLALACAALLDGSPTLPGGLDIERPTLGGVLVGNPGDSYIKFDGIEGEVWDTDLTADGTTHEHDLGSFFDLLGTNDASADFDGDGEVDGNDFARLIRAWN